MHFLARLLVPPGCSCWPRHAAASPSSARSTSCPPPRAAPPRRRCSGSPRGRRSGAALPRPVARALAPGRPRTSCRPSTASSAPTPSRALVFALDRKRNLVTLDLETRRVRTYLEQVRSAAAGPGRRALRRGHGQHRDPDGPPRPDPVPHPSCRAVRARRLRHHDGRPARPRGRQGAGARGARLRPGARSRPPCPGEPIAPSFYGDLVAVATDTARGAVYETQGQARPRSIRLSGHARGVVFSPSGHRIYVAQDDDELLVLDRFSGDRLGAIDLPGPAKGAAGRPVRTVAPGPAGRRAIPPG